MLAQRQSGKQLNIKNMKNENSKKSKIVIEHITKPDGTKEIRTTAAGFSPLEILGLLDLLRGEVIRNILKTKK